VLGEIPMVILLYMICISYMAIYRARIVHSQVMWRSQFTAVYKPATIYELATVYQFKVGFIALLGSYHK
jgi:hypothetical protein